MHSKQKFCINFFLAKFEKAKEFKRLKKPQSLNGLNDKILGFKIKPSLWVKYISITWRVIIAAFFIFFIFSGRSPLDSIYAQLNSSNEERTIAFYSQQVYQLEDSISWQNLDKVTAKPEVRDDGDFIKFDNTNSAFFIGGQASFTLSDFQPAAASSLIATSAGAAGRTNDNEINQLDSGTATDTLDTIQINDQAGGLGNQTEEVEIVEPETELPANQVEVISGQVTRLKNSLVKKITQITKRLKQSYQGIVAWAEISLGKGTNDDYTQGKLLRARLKLSLASIQTGIKISAPASDENNATSTEIEQMLASSTDDVIDFSNNASEQASTASVEKAIEPKVEIINPETEDITVDIASENGSTVNDDGPQEILPEAEPATTNFIENQINSSGEIAPIADPEKPTSYLGKIFAKLKTPVAQAQNATETLLNDGYLVVWYTLDDLGVNATNTDDTASTSSSRPVLWQKVDIISLPNISNQLNGGYLSLDLPAIKSWEDINKLKIKIEGIAQGETKFVTYLDSVWVEADYQPVAKLKAEEKRDHSVQILEFLSVTNDFISADEVTLKFRYQKIKHNLISGLTDLVGLTDYWRQINISAEIVNNQAAVINVPLTMIFENNGEFIVKLSDLPPDFRPGRYRVKFKIEDKTGDVPEIMETEQDFTYGVVALNFNKSIYLVSDTAYIQLAALDNGGNTICDADITLDIILPDRTLTTLSTDNGLVSRNPDCAGNNVINRPDYYAYQILSQIGTYEINLYVKTRNGTRAVRAKLAVQEELPFAIEREGPTRINPRAEYNMKIKIKANAEYQGEIKEKVPNSFAANQLELRSKNNETGEYVVQPATTTINEVDNSKELVWSEVSLKPGDEVALTYNFDAPDISPVLYALGTAQIGDFVEARQWEIAADNPGTINHYYKNYDGATTTPEIDYAIDGWYEITEFMIASTTFTAGNKYLIVINFATNASTTGASSMARVRHGSTEFSDSRFIWKSRDNTLTNVGQGYQYFAVWPAVSGEDIHIDVSTYNDKSIIRAKDYEAMVINLSDNMLTEGTDWLYAASTHSGKLPITWTTNGASLTFDGKAKDWLIIGFGHFLGRSVGPDFALRLYNATTTSAYSQLRYEVGSSTDERPIMAMIGTSTGLGTWRVDATADTLNTHEWTDSKLFALNLGFFKERWVGYSTTAVSITPLTTWVETYSKTDYAAGRNGDILVWSQEVADVAANNKTIFSRLTIDGTVVPAGHDDAIKDLPIGATDEDAHHNFYIGSVNQGTRAIRVYMQNTTGTAPVSDIHSLAIFSLEMKSPPTGSFISAGQPDDGTGSTTIAIEVNDADGDDCRARIEYVAGASCDFTTPNNPTLNESTSTITADFGSPRIDNNYTAYKVGTTTGWIKTDSGSNSVSFIWLTKTDLPNVDGIYCLRLTTNDQLRDQVVKAITTLIVDNIAPTQPGNLTLETKTSESVTVRFGATSTESHFKEYRIFYATSTPVTEASFIFASSSDANLGNIDFNSKATTTVTGLATSTKYYFVIYAYDQYGNRASSTGALEATTNIDPDNPVSLEQYKNDGVTAIANGAWTEENTVKLSANSTDGDTSEVLTLYFELFVDSGTFTTATTVPAGACATTTAFNDCASKIWSVTSPEGDYRSAPYIGVAAISGLPQDYNGYKWQALACDDFNACSANWTQFNDATPNFKTDLAAPTKPGALVEGGKTLSSITLNFGATTTEDNFLEYKIFYNYNLASTTEFDFVHASNTDANLGVIDFNEAASTVVSDLNPDTTYVFNIWAYDLAGNRASATEEAIIKTLAQPTGAFNSVEERSDGSGVVDISIEVNSSDGKNCRAKLEYVAGADCNFAAPADPSLDETDANITADFGDPDIDNNFAYQVGTTTSWIITNQGANTVNFDWLSQLGLPLTEGIYCLRLTVNDGDFDQVVLATTTLMIDNKAPTTPGSITLAEARSNSMLINFGATSSDLNFFEYKIFYKIGTAGVTESDSLHSSSSDPNLGDIDFNSASQTTVSGLTAGTDYVFNIWAYDAFGNKASATAEMTASSTYAPRSQHWRWYLDKDNETPTVAAAPENSAPLTITCDTTLKLRLTINEVGGVIGENIKMRLQYSTLSDFSSDVYFLGEIGSSTAAWTYADGGGNDNELINTRLLSDATASATHNEVGTSVSNYTHAASTAGEWEFTIRNNSASEAVVYYFRAYDNTNSGPVAKETGEAYPSLGTAQGSLTYTVEGLTAGTTTEGVITDITASTSNINFGNLTIDTDKVGAQRFVVDTNAGYGYQLFVYERQSLISNGGSTFDPVPGTNASPLGWPASPDPSAYGYHTSDETLSGASPSRFLPNNTYARFEIAPKEIGYSPIPVNNNMIDLVYRLEASNLQAAGSYETEMVYILVPTF